MKHALKAKARLDFRRAQWARLTEREKLATTRPGSLKKPVPAGKGKAWR